VRAFGESYFGGRARLAVDRNFGVAWHHKDVYGYFLAGPNLEKPQQKDEADKENQAGYEQNFVAFCWLHLLGTSPYILEQYL
jgi:hypothetical protein